MLFVNTFLLAASALATLASAINTVQFVNQDNTTRNIVFTSQEDLNMPKIPNLVVSGMQTANQTFPTGWTGNFYSYNEGAEDVPGMLGEVRFDGWDGITFYDVSAIVRSIDTEGIKQMYALGTNPLKSTSAVSGCPTAVGKCLNQYNNWDDVATQASKSSALVCTLGNPTVVARRQNTRLYPRSFLNAVESP